MPTVPVFAEPAPDSVACIGEGTDNCYPTLREAIEAAEDGNIIKLIADDDVSFKDSANKTEIVINKNVTIDGKKEDTE
jgi:uncharacterized protein YdeI (BOF family)